MPLLQGVWGKWEQNHYVFSVDIPVSRAAKLADFNVQFWLAFDYQMHAVGVVGLDFVVGHDQQALFLGALRFVARNLGCISR